MRNRISAERNSAPPTFGMESIDFRKFGRRNLGARWGATTARAPAGLENYRPQLCNHCTFHWCRGGFRIPWEPKKRTKTDKTNLSKTTTAIGDAKPACANGWVEGVGARQTIQTRCKTLPFSIPTTPPHTTLHITYSATIKE